MSYTRLNGADYIVEQGTSGIWTYRKWKSGIAECWGTYTASIAVTNSSASYGGYRSGLITATAFPFTFASTPSITATIGRGATGAWVSNVADSNTTNVKFYLAAGASLSAASRVVHIHAIGTWE